MEKQQRKAIVIIKVENEHPERIYISRVHVVGSLRKMTEVMKDYPDPKRTWQKMEDYKKQLGEGKYVRIHLNDKTGLVIKQERI